MTSSSWRSRGPAPRATRLLALAAWAVLSACSTPPVQAPAPSVPLAAAFAHSHAAQAEGAAAGAAWWAVVVASVVSVLGAIGQGVAYHYFTDSVGALLLGSAVVRIAAVVAELDTRQPGCDADHTAG